MAPFMVRDVELIQENHEVLVLHLVNPRDMSAKEIDVPGVRVVRVPFHHTKPRTWLAAAAAVRQHARGADLVHTMALPALLPAWLAASKRPWVHTEHYSELVPLESTQRRKASMAVLKNLLRLPDQSIAVGAALAEVIARFSKEPPTVVANEVAMAPVCRLPEEELRSDGPVRMVAVGGLIPRKGPLETVQSVALLRDRGIDARLTWVGVGPLEQEVRELCTSLGVQDHVELLGSVPPEAIPAVLARGNVFVLPTGNETFGVAIAEALAHGLPVVTSGVGGHLEFLPPEASRVVDERTGPAIADAVVSLMEDKTRWGTDRLIEYAKREFSKEARLAAYTSVYERAMENGG